MCIQCRILDLDCLSDPQVMEHYLEKIPVSGYWKQRRESMRKYRFAEDRIRSLGAGLLLLSVLREYGLQNAEIECNAYGKPLLCGSDFQFNLSHSGKYSVCSYGFGSSGIDIENYQCAAPDLAKRFFHPKEYELVAEHGNKMFIRLWTLKESYIKADGRGLSLGLETFHICPGELKPEFHCAESDLIPAFCDQTSVAGDHRFNFVEYTVSDYHVAVCSKNPIKTTLIQYTLT